MKNVNLFFLAILLSLFNYLEAQESINFDKLFTDWTQSNEAKPGLAISVIKGQKVVYKKAFGIANLEYGIKIENNSVFDIASLAKQFTGFAIAKLIYEKKLSEDDPVQEFLPELKNLGPNMEIRHLLHHSSGLRDIGELFGIGHYGVDLTSMETLQIMEAQKDMNFAIGDESDYSNTNYVLLAIIVERVSGISFRTWCAENIFKPLEMNKSFANDNPREIIPNRVMAYYGQNGEYTYMQNNGMSLIGSSAVFSSINDMAKWSMELQSPKKFAPIIEMMKSGGLQNDGQSINYGFGLGLAEYEGRKLIAHTGATPSGFNTVIGILPEEEISVVVLSNWGDLDLTHQYMHKIFNQLLGIESKNEDPFGMVASTTTALELAPEAAEKFVGTYLFNEHMKVEIMRIGNKLTVAPEGRGEMMLKAISEDELDFPDFRSTLKFIADINGVYTHAEIYQGGEQAGSLKRIVSVEGTTLKTEDYEGTYYSEELDMYFKIKGHNGALIAKDSKHGETKLIRKTEFVFGLEAGFAHGLVFEKDQDGKAVQFLLSSGSRVRNVKFKKLDMPE